MRPRLALTTLLAVLVGAPALSCGSDPAPSGTPDAAREVASAPQATPPSPDEGIPQDPAQLAKRLRTTTGSLHRAIDRWLEERGAGERAPREVKLLALHQQRIYVLLTPREKLTRAVLGRLRGPVAAAARDTLAARRALRTLSTPVPKRRIRTGRALPAAKLIRLYRRAERRFDVPWKLLAAVNFIESAFNKVRNRSTAGAQGPMQFIPSTWAAYGMGGDVHDPRDAIMGAANYLRASGAPGNIRRALYAYNPSSAYVEAVLRYTRQIRRDRRAFFAFHSWQVFVHTPSGIRQLTGPGADR